MKKTPPTLAPSLQVRLVCENIPEDRFAGCDGRRDIRVTLQTKDGHESGSPVDPASVSWTTSVTLKSTPEGMPDYSGSAVQGKRGERFFYLSWSGEKDGRRAMFRRLKIQLRDLAQFQLTQALETGGAVEARVHAVAKDGGPACATVPLLGGGWTVLATPNF